MFDVAFAEELQNFAKFFRSVSEGVEVSKVKPISNSEESKIKEYFVFDDAFINPKGKRLQKSGYKNIDVSIIQRDNVYYAGKNIWILKPTNLNRGRGLEIFDNLEDLNAHLKDYYEGYSIKNYKDYQVSQDAQKETEKNAQTDEEAQINEDSKPLEEGQKDEVIPKEEDEEESPKDLLSLEEIPKDILARKPLPAIQKSTKSSKDTKKKSQLRSLNFIIQKYMEVPLTLHKRKFDIRCYAMVTHEHKLHYFKHAYLRLSSEEYTLDRKEYFIHLTNNAVQKNSNNYCSFEDGNIISLLDFEKRLAAERGQEADTYVGTFNTKITEIIKLVFESVKGRFDPKKRSFSFEVFGFDIMIDQNLKCWLIEVNTNPCLEESNDVLAHLIPRMVDDFLKLTLDKIFPASKEGSKLRTFPIDGEDDEENLWTQIADLGSNPKKSSKQQKKN